MSVSSIGVDTILNQSYAAESSDTKSDTVDTQEEFLLLLVTQLQNQDPLNPLEAQEFAVQLAQFSQVERLMNIESALEANSESVNQMTDASNKSFASLMIGMAVRTEGNTIIHVEDSENELQFSLGEDAKSVTIKVKDSDGKLVRTYSPGALAEGEQSYTWDGKDTEGNSVESGKYTFEVTAQNADGAVVTTEEYQIGIVEGVRYKDGATPMVVINGVEIPLSDVKDVWAYTASEE